MSKRHATLGHNGGVPLDPGPATDFEDIGPIALRVEDLEADDIQSFYRAIRTQGDPSVRQKAISCMLERARANAALSHGAYRVLEQIAERCRWRYRYHSEPAASVAFFTGLKDGKNLHRWIDELLKFGFIARVILPRKGGGHGFPLYTVVCTPEDRSGATSTDLYAAAKAKRLEVMDHKPLVRRDEPATRRYDDLQVVIMTNCNTSKRRNATRHHDGQIVEEDIVEEDIVGESDSSSQRLESYTIALRDNRATLEELHDEAFASAKLLGWVRDLPAGMMAEAMSAIDRGVVAELGAVLPDAELRESFFQVTDRRVDPEICSPAGLYAIRYLAGALIDDSRSPQDALLLVLSMVKVRIGDRPRQQLNSLALIGKRLVGEYGTKKLPPVPPTSSGALTHLIEADGAKTLAQNLRGDGAGLDAFLQEQAAKHRVPVSTIVAVIEGVLSRLMLDGELGSIRSWSYFAGAIADELRAQRMAEQGIRPGDVLGRWRATNDGEPIH